MFVLKEGKKYTYDRGNSTFPFATRKSIWKGLNLIDMKISVLVFFFQDVINYFLVLCFFLQLFSWIKQRKTKLVIDVKNFRLREKFWFNSLLKVLFLSFFFVVYLTYVEINSKWHNNCCYSYIRYGKRNNEIICHCM